jgi:hypothetical protein
MLDAILPYTTVGLALTIIGYLAWEVWGRPDPPTARRKAR